MKIELAFLSYGTLFQLASVWSIISGTLKNFVITIFYIFQTDGVIVVCSPSNAIKISSQSFGRIYKTNMSQDNARKNYDQDKKSC
jgi:hypothetical protein